MLIAALFIPQTKIDKPIEVYSHGGILIRNKNRFGYTRKTGLSKIMLSLRKKERKKEYLLYFSIHIIFFKMKTAS